LPSGAWAITPFGMPLVADEGGQGPGVDAGDADDAARLQPGIEWLHSRGSSTGSVMSARRTAPRRRRRRHVHRLDVFVVGTPTLPIWGKVKVMIWPA
jgi:hypothetical protein